MKFFVRSAYSLFIAVLLSAPLFAGGDNDQSQLFYAEMKK